MRWRVWDVEQAAEIRAIPAHWVSSLATALSSAGRQLVYGATHAAVTGWDVPSGDTIRRLRGPHGAFSHIAITPDARLLASAGQGGFVDLWSLDHKDAAPDGSHLTDDFGDVAVTPDGEHAVTVSNSRTVRIWRIADGTELWSMDSGGERLTAVAVTADRRNLISSSEDGVVQVWDSSAPGRPRLLGRHKKRVPGFLGTFWMKAVATSSCGQFAFAASDRDIKKWSLAQAGTEKARARVLRGHAETVTSLAAAADAQILVSGAFDRTIKVWDIDRNEHLFGFRAHESPVVSVAVSADGTRALSGSVDGQVLMWDLDHRRQVGVLVGHIDAVTKLAFLPDGQHAVSVSHDRTLKLWHLPSQILVATFSADNPLETCAVSVDGATVIACGGRGQIHFLRVEALSMGVAP